MSNSARRHGGNRRGIGILALAATLGITTLTLSQCRLVQDNVTGVDVTASRLSARSACVRSCNDTFKAAQESEESRYRNAVRACGNDDACRDAARDQHRVIKDQIEDAKKACKNNCYNEGSGSSDR